MTAATLDPIATEFADASVVSFAVQASAKGSGRMRGPIAWLLWLPLTVAAWVTAQALPFYVRALLDRIEPLLPHLTDRAALRVMEDAAALYLQGLRDARGRCLARRTLAEVTDRTDELLDSLQLVNERGDELRAIIERIDAGTAR